MKKALIICAVFLFCHSFETSFAQDNHSGTLEKARKFEEDGNIKVALSLYSAVLKSDSTSLEALCHASILTSKTAHHQSSAQTKLQLGRQAEMLARKALSLHAASAMAHYALALAIGVISEDAVTKTKIHNAGLIRNEAEKAIKLNPNLAGPWHIVGKWHQVVAGFNSFERAMIRALFEDIGKGSYEEALRYFQKAISLEPKNAAHYYELANTYYQRDEAGDKIKALSILNTGVKFHPRNEDEQLTLTKIRKLLENCNKSVN